MERISKDVMIAIDHADWLWVRRPENMEDPKSGKAYPQPWTCDKDTKKGQIALVYVTLPTSAILKIVKVKSDAKEHPEEKHAGWEWKCRFDVLDTFGVPLTRQQMIDDLRLKEWKAVCKNFQDPVFAIDQYSSVLSWLLSELNRSSE
jgi:hypothetical protein